MPARESHISFIRRNLSLRRSNLKSEAINDDARAQRLPPCPPEGGLMLYQIENYLMMKN
jgi:hypothetical protein